LTECTADFSRLLVLAASRRASPSLENGATFYSSLEELLPYCEVLTLHVPRSGTPIMMKKNSPCCRRARFSSMPLVARWSTKRHLYDALTSGHLFGAGLDVYRNEPNVDPRFASLDNVFLSPHMASATVETRDQMVFTALDNIAAVLDGRLALNPV